MARTGGVNMTATGFIDVHNHLLPGIDDGCSQLDDSLVCIRQLLSHGFVGAVCTPHVCIDAFPDNVPLQIEQHVRRLQDATYAAGLDFPLWAGAEVRIAAKTVAWFEEFGVPTLGNGRAVLIDYWDDRWEPFCDHAVTYLLERDYLPILAHPERMALPDERLDDLLDRLQEWGVQLQGNLRCLAGGEGPLPQGRIRRWLREDRYHLLATDMHSSRCLPARLAGIPQGEQDLGRERLVRLLRDHGFELLQVDPAPLIAAQQGTAPSTTGLGR